MKKLALFLFGAFVLLTLPTQKASAQITVGGGLNAGTDELGPGLTLTGTYGIQEKIRVAGGLSLYFPKDADMWSVDLNGQYTFMTKDLLNVYGLGGLNFTKTKVEVLGSDFTDSAIGINLGAGADYAFGPGMLFGEFKLVAITDYDRAELWVGFRYPLGGK